MGGIIMGALGGLGAGMQQTAQALNASAMQDQQLDGQKQLAQMQSDLGLQKAQALAQFQSDLADTNREDMVDRINEAKTGIIGKAIASKYAQSDAAAQDAAAGNTDAPLTPDQQAAIDQSKAIDSQRLADDPNVYRQAATQTGDLDPKTVATMANQQEIMGLKMNQYAQSVQAKLDAANNRTEMMGAIAQLRVEAAGGKDGKLPSDAKMIEYLVQHGETYESARDKVMGTGAGATKDPVAMAAQLASSLIASGAVRVPKDAPPGTTVMSLAMDMATAQIQAAESKFGRGTMPGAPPPAKPTPSTVPNPVAPKADPLGLFKK